MSAISSTSSSAASYATQLAQASTLKRSLNNIGDAIEAGDMTSAGALLTSFIQANPQYAAGASGNSQDPISQDFQTLVTAVSNNQVSAAQSAWTQVKSDLTKDGVNLSSGSDSTAEAVAQSQASTEEEILSASFGAGGSSSVASLLGGSGGSSGTVGLSSSLLDAWITGDDGGSSSSAATPASGTAITASALLNTTA